MAQSSIGTTAETSNVMRLLRNRSQSETKDFMDDFTKHLKLVLDSLEGSQKVFWLIQSDMITQTVTIKLGATLGITDLPLEVQEQVFKETRDEIAKEHGEITIKYEGTIPPKPKTSLEERIHEIEEQHPEPRLQRVQQIPQPPEEQHTPTGELN